MEIAMYRIHFDHKIGRFTIQVLIFGLFWRDIALSDDIEPISDRATFKTIDEAIQYVKSIGLDRLYTDKSVNKFNNYMVDGGTRESWR